MRRQLPNLLTTLRILAIPMLAWLAVQEARGSFGVVLIACLLGDVADGALARALDATSALGALLDSIADTLLFFMTLVGVLVFYPEAVQAHAVAFATVPAAWLAENVAALLRYGRLSSFHTYLSRLAAVALGVFASVLFVWGFSTVWLYAAASLVLLATLEEFVLLWLLPEWTPNVKGLWWIRRSA